MPQRAKVSRVCRLSQGISSVGAEPQRVRAVGQDRGQQAVGVAPASPAHKRRGPAGVSTSTSGSSQ